MEGPDSSYSSLEIHICWKVESEARMEPPIQTEYFLSLLRHHALLWTLGIHHIATNVALSRA